MRHGSLSQINGIEKKLHAQWNHLKECQCTQICNTPSPNLLILLIVILFYVELSESERALWPVYSNVVADGDNVPSADPNISEPEPNLPPPCIADNHQAH